MLTDSNYFNGDGDEPQEQQQVAPTFEPQSFNIVGIDPGAQNLGVAVARCDVTAPGKATVTFKHPNYYATSFGDYELTPDRVAAAAQVARAAMRPLEDYRSAVLKTFVFMEKQYFRAQIDKQHTANPQAKKGHDLCLIEQALASAFRLTHRAEVFTPTPQMVKGHFGTGKGSNAANKKAAIDFVRDTWHVKVNDHVADAMMLAVCGVERTFGVAATVVVEGPAISVVHGSAESDGTTPQILYSATTTSTV